MGPLVLALFGDALSVDGAGLVAAVNASTGGSLHASPVGALHVSTVDAFHATPVDAVTLAASFGVDQIAVLTIGGVAVVLGLFGAWYGLRLRRHGYKGEGGGTLDRDRAERERNLAAAEAKRAAKAARKRG